MKKSTLSFASWSQFLLRQNQGGQEQGVCSTSSVLPPTSQPRSASPSPCWLNSDCRTNLSVPGMCVCPWTCLWVFVLPGTLSSSPSLQLPPPLTPRTVWSLHSGMASLEKLIEMHLLRLFLTTNVWSSCFGAQKSEFYKPSRGFWHPLKFETASLQHSDDSQLCGTLDSSGKFEDCWCSELYSRTVKSESLGVGPRN